MARRLHVLVVGAGIGGLSTAIALRRRGLGVTVLERQPEVREIGAGLSLWPNATHALEMLGLGDVVRELGTAAVDGAIRNERGRTLSTTALAALAERYGAPAVFVHRAELLSALRDRLDAEVRCSATAVGFAQDRGGVELHLEGGEAVFGDALLGADGLGSAIRAALGLRARPRAEGHAAWRGVTALADARLPAGESPWALYLGPGTQAGVAPLSRGRVYWFVAVKARPGGPEGPGAGVDALHAHLEGWPAALRAVVAATPPEAVLRHDLFDLPPLRRWHRGRVALLGDAAHATTPNLGQGACLAVEDAVVVARCLDGGSVPAALSRYERQRRRRCNRAVAASRRLGRVLQLENGLLRRIRDGLIARESERTRIERHAWLLDHRV